MLTDLLDPTVAADVRRTYARWMHAAAVSDHPRSACLLVMFASSFLWLGGMPAVLQLATVKR